MRPVDDSGSPKRPPGRPARVTGGDPHPPSGPMQAGVAGRGDASGPGPSPSGGYGIPSGGYGPVGPPTGSDLAGADGYASRPPRPPRGSSPASRPIGGIGSGRHRRDGETGEEPGDPGDAPGRPDTTSRPPDAGKKRKSSFWRELPLLILVALVLTFVVQTFVGRVYVIPSGSMERTLYGGVGGNVPDDRVAVDKMVYRFSDPAPGEVVVFKGPPEWISNDEVPDDRSSSALVRGLQQAASLIGFPYGEKDFVKRVIAVGGQTVACCDAQNRVSVDGRPLTEPYLYYQQGFGSTQRQFGPITVPPDALWVMGDNRNNSLDARAHGPVPVADVIGKARAVVLPVNHWGVVHTLDPQARPSALGGPGPPPGMPLAAGLLLAVPTVRGARRRAGTGATVAEGPPRPPGDGS